MNNEWVVKTELAKDVEEVLGRFMKIAQKYS
jgi:hypothetical protein